MASQLALLKAFLTSIVTTAQYRFPLRFCLDAFSALSTTVRIASMVDFPFRNPNCEFDKPCSLSVNFVSLLRIIVSKSFPSVSSRYIGLYDARSQKQMSAYT